jgi:hypothetical protein
LVITCLVGCQFGYYLFGWLLVLLLPVWLAASLVITCLVGYQFGYYLFGWLPVWLLPVWWAANQTKDTYITVWKE